MAQTLCALGQSAGLRLLGLRSSTHGTVSLDDGQARVLFQPDANFAGNASLTLALAGRRSPANPGKAMARLTLSYGAAQIIAPAVTGAMAQASGSFKGGLWLTAVVMTVGLLLLATLPRED